MRIIKIFLASSEELKDERKEMADLVQDLNFSLNNRGLSIQLVKWEYLNSDMGPEHKQEEYNRELRECEMCVVIFWTRFGTYTKKELDVAYEGRCTEGRNPQRLWVYFKDGSEQSEELRLFRESFTKNYEHFCGFFVNVDTLKYNFLSQFIKYLGLRLKDNYVNIEDSKVVIDGKAYVNLNNVPSFANNEDYQLLLKDIKKTEKLLVVTYIDDDEYREYADDLQRLYERRKQMESSMWDTALLIAELSNKTCSERLHRAIDLFNKGDNKGACAILNEEEICRDAQHNLHLIRLGEQGKKGLETNIDELLLKVRTLINDRKDGWYIQVEHLYDTCVEWGHGNVPAKKMYEIYAGASTFLYNQCDYDKALMFSKERLKISRQLATNQTLENEVLLAATLRDIATIEWSNKYFSDSEAYYMESLKIYRRLAKSTPSAYEPGFAITLGNLASLYLDTNRHTDSESYYMESLEIYRRLAKYNPSAYEPDLARMLGNLASLYLDTNRHTDSEAYYMESLEIFRQLAKYNPSAYEPGMAMTLGNLALLYYRTNRHTDSDAYYMESLEIYRRLAKSNPSAYEPDLARTLDNLASLYLDTNRHTDSESYYMESLEIYRRLAKSNPSAYEPGLARTLGNLATLYYRINRHTDSESYYMESLEIYRRLAKYNPSAYEPDLVRTLGNLALLYSDTNRHTDSESYYMESLEIFRRLAKSNPSAYEPNLARTLCNLASLYLDTNRHTDSESYYMESLEIFRRLAKSDPSAYEPDLAITLCNLASLYNEINRYAEAESLYTESLELYRSLSCSSSPSPYGLDVARILGGMAFNAICQKEFVVAENLSREAITIDPTQTFIYTNLAPSLLFQGKIIEAEAIYLEYKSVEKDSFLDDFKRFEELGIIPKERKDDVERIKKMLNN